MVTKERLKQEIEQLDDDYLELVFRLLQQFPHSGQIAQKPDALQCSRVIDYAVPEVDDAPVLLCEDAASYGKQLRTSLWQRH